MIASTVPASETRVRTGSGARAAGPPDPPARDEAGDDLALRLPIEDAIDLHPFAPRDIPAVVTEYLEEAARAGYAEVRLIHGRGIGAQREAVRKVCGRHPRVATFADAPSERGGWGATVVRLRPE